jgi:hypothetical protein
MNKSEVRMLALALLAPSSFAQPMPTAPTNLKAPTYYVAADIQECNSGLVRLKGASNLPTGSRLQVQIGELKGSAIVPHGNSEASVRKDGTFAVEVRPVQGKEFRSHLVGLVNFETAWNDQPKSVTDIVGTHGERLGDFKNPQFFQRSGWYYGLTMQVFTAYCPKANDQRPTTND